MKLLDILKQQRALMREHLDRIEEMIEEEEIRILARKEMIEEEEIRILARKVREDPPGDESAEIGVGA
jgi:hypothetical protein